MGVHPNAEIARQLWLATAKGDAEGLRGLLSPNVRWTSHSAGDLSDAVEGPDAVIGLLARSGELVEELRSDVIDIFASDRGAVIHYRLRAERSGLRLDLEVVLIARIAQGVIVDVQTIPSDARANQAFWSAS